jgi:hypothetical protein
MPAFYTICGRLLAKLQYAEMIVKGLRAAIQLFVVSLMGSFPDRVQSSVGGYSSSPTS